MAVEQLEVIVTDKEGRQEYVVELPVQELDTVAALKARLAEARGIDPATMTVVFNGVELDDRHQLRHCGLRTAQDMTAWAGERIYPNGWFLMGAARKPFSLMKDAGWGPLRTPEGAGWIWALCGAVLLGNAVLCG